MSGFFKENINGILGTVIFHLLIIVVIMVTKLSSGHRQDEHSILIEFQPDITAEEFQELTESLMERTAFMEGPDDGQTRRNLAVNVSEERPVSDYFKDMSTEEMSELESRMDEILENAANGSMPQLDQPEIEFEMPRETVQNNSRDDEPYSGPTTITYDLPGRRHLRMSVPVYKCPDGGIAEVSISVNQEGRVISADIRETPGNFNERCVFEMAVKAAMASRFDANTNSPVVQSGTITFYFQKQ